MPRPTISSRCSRGSRRAARRCCTCRTGCQRSSGSAIGSPCLRDGGFVETSERRDVTPQHIVRAMVGRDLPPRAVFEPSARAESAAALARGRPGTASVLPQHLADGERRRNRRAVRSGRIGAIGAARNDLRALSAAKRARSACSESPLTRPRRVPRRAPASRWCRKSGSVRGCSSTSTSATTW